MTLRTQTDKSGRPLNIHHFGRINTTELYKGISAEKFWQAFLVNADSLTREVLPAAACAAGKPIGGTFVIVDLKGFGYALGDHRSSTGTHQSCTTP